MSCRSPSVLRLPQPFYKRRLALQKPEHDRLSLPFTHHHSKHNHSVQRFKNLHSSETVPNKTQAIRNISAVQHYCRARKILKPSKYCSSYTHQVNLHLKSLTFAGIVYLCASYISRTTLLLRPNTIAHGHDRCKWIPVTTACRFLRLRMEDRLPIWTVS